MTKTKILYLLILFLLTITLFSGCTSQENSYYNLYGLITTENFNSPIEGAEIIIADKTAQTNSEGQFSLKKIKSGIYTLKIKSNKYKNVSYQVSIKSDTKINKQLSLESGDAIVKGNIILHNEAGYYSKNNSLKNKYLKVNNIKNKEFKKGEVIVKYKEILTMQSIKNKEKKQNLQKLNSLNTKRGKLLRYQIPKDKTVKEMVKYYNNISEVEFAEPNYIINKLAVPSDPYYKDQWGHIAANLEAAWDQNKNSKSIKIAIIDSGIIPEHPDLKERLLNGADFVGGTQNDSPSDYNITDYDPTDESTDSSHGTHVTGIIGAVGNNDKGVTGVNWDSSLLPIRVLGADGSGTIWDFAEGIYYAIDQNIDIINMSLGGSYSNLGHYAIQDAYNEGIVLVAAAGNSGIEGLNYPAAYNETIGVGAINQNLKKADYSNYGPKLDLVGPGSVIYSTSGYYDQGDTFSNYQYMSGTSMAAPYVTGAAALLMAQEVKSYNIKNRLVNTAVDLGVSGRDDYYGYGLVDVYGALINKKLKNPYVFAANIKNGNIYIKSEMTRMNRDGSYSLTEVVDEKVYIMGWRDVNENQKVDSGDYFGKYSSKLNISDKMIDNVNFEIYYVTQSSTTDMKVKNINDFN